VPGTRLPDLDELVAACTAALPTTLLTNGMQLRGHRLARLQRMDRTRLVLQISLDSATPARHDRHRGTGSWAGAVAGIRTAQSAGFRVRIAATLPPDQIHQLGRIRAFLDSLHIDRDDQLIRALAHRGAAQTGLELTVESLIPEVTVTADGVYWHPVSAEGTDQLITRDLFPLRLATAADRSNLAFGDRPGDGAGPRAKLSTPACVAGSFAVHCQV